MNYKNEPYPKDFSTLIEKCDQTQSLILEQLNHPESLTLLDLYNHQSQMFIKFENFLEKIKHKPNSRRSKTCEIDNEIKGLYVFGERNSLTGAVTPVYVGISRKVFSRLKNHGWGKLHNQATLAYLMTSSKPGYADKRIDFDILKYPEVQAEILNYRVAIVPEPLDYDLYFMEVYLAGKLKTKWNSFKTH